MNTSEIKVLSSKERNQIHQNALKLLKNVGMKFRNEEALDILEKAGARVASKKVVKFPQEMISEKLKICPSSVEIYDRDLTSKQCWGKEGNRYMGAGGSAIHFLDNEANISREATTEDLLKSYKLMDNLPEISWAAPGFLVNDVPQEIAGVWRFFLRLKYGLKATCPDGLSVQDLIDNLKLLKEVRGGIKISEKPFGPIQTCPTPPLSWSQEGAGFIIIAAKEQYPLSIMPMPSVGAGAPVTLAGAVTQQVAEALSAIVLTQTISPGTPCIYSGAPNYMDIRYGNSVFSSIEIALVHIANTQMGDFYNIPTSTGDCIGGSDSKVPDFQAGAESATFQILAALAGNDAPVGLGFLGSQSTYSLEKLVADHDICRMTNRLLEGIKVDEKNIAYNVIKDVGPGGNYLTHEHSVKRFKQNYQIPDVFNRQEKEAWENSNAKDTRNNSSIMVDQILEDSDFSRIDSDLDSALNQKISRIFKERGLNFDNFINLLP